MQKHITYPLKSDEVVITKFFFINCLPDNDIGIFNRCYDDITINILDKTQYKGRYQRIDCDCAARFLNALDQIYNEVNQYRLGNAAKANNVMKAILPFIQIEAHGAEHYIQMANGEKVSSTIFYEKILKINIASENNTILLSNTCYGMSHILSPVGYTSTRQKGYPIATPAYVAISPDQEIYSSHIEKHVYELFHDLITHEGVGQKIIEYATNVNMKIYHCEQRWRELIRLIINEMYPYKKHKESRLTHFITNTPVIKIAPLKIIRKTLKKEYNNELLIAFDTAEKYFLIGKKSTYTLFNVIRDVNKQDKR